MHDFTAAVETRSNASVGFTMEDMDVISNTLEFVTSVPSQLSEETVAMATQLMLTATTVTELPHNP